MNIFHSLQIQNIIKETANAVSLVLDIPKSLKEEFRFTAGQYINIKTTIDNKEVKRAYSICSTPNRGEIKIAIKAIENGTFSVYATSQLKDGDTLDVSLPEGKFVLNPENNKNYIAFAAGSGITPILSMVKATLEENNSAKFYLIYGNKSENDVIFKNELDSLKDRFSDRFNLHYIYSQQNITDCLFGRIDEENTNYFIKNIYSDVSFDSVFLCGPEGMINTVSNTLQANGILKENIFFELFTTSSKEENTNQIKYGETVVTVLLDDEEIEFTMKQEDNLLTASLRNKVDAPYSCQGGVCSSCMAIVTKGKAVMTKNSVLTDEEIAEGLVLTCQAHPTTPKLFLDFDNV